MKKIALVFPGQGTQVPGMGKEFIDKYDVAKKFYKEASEILGRDIEKICFNSSERELKETVNSQIAIFVTSFAMYKTYIEEIGIEPEYLAGHSLGEYIALTCGGALDFEEAIKLVDARGRIMQKANKGKMIAVNNLAVSDLESIIYKMDKNENIISISCYNSTNQNVISVSENSVDIVIDKLKSAGARVKELSVSSGFHSVMMKKAADELSIELDKCNFKEPKHKIISNVTAMPYINSDEIKIRLFQHMTNPVRWKDTIKYLVDNNVEYAIEIGMGHVLKSLASKSAIKLPIITLNTPYNFEDIRKTIGSLEIEKNNIIKKCVKESIMAPNKNVYDDLYREKVENNCKKLKQIYTDNLSIKNEIGIDDFKVIFKLLKEIFEGKSLPIKEQEDIFNQLNSDLRKLNINL